jgi:hypothetical protein
VPDQVVAMIKMFQHIPEKMIIDSVLKGLKNRVEG